MFDFFKICSAVCKFVGLLYAKNCHFEWICRIKFKKPKTSFCRVNSAKFSVAQKTTEHPQFLGKCNATYQIRTPVFKMQNLHSIMLNHKPEKIWLDIWIIFGIISNYLTCKYDQDAVCSFLFSCQARHYPHQVRVTSIGVPKCRTVSRVQTKIQNTKRHMP